MLIFSYLFLDATVTDLIDFTSPDTHRTDMTQSDIGKKIE